MEADRSYSGTERAAVLMMLVGEDEAAAILQKLDPDEVRALGSAMFAVAEVSEDEVAGVLDDFVAKARDRTTIGFDPRPRVEGMMTRALGSTRADSVLQRILPAEEGCAIEVLPWLDAREIAAAIEGEHPQLAAVLIAHLEAGVAAEVLELLPDAVQPDVLHRLARLGPVGPEAIAALTELLGERLGHARPAPIRTLGGVGEVAKIMNSARRATGQRVMPRLAKLDKVVAREVEEQMFVFDHLLDLDEKNLGTLLRSVDGELLVRALKGADDRVLQHFLGCMSSRAADGIRDELEGAGPMKLSEVQDAQRQIVGIAKALARDGSIQMAGGDDDYV